MKELITYQGVVYPQHCDFNQHMNVMHYVGKFDQATWFLFDHAGITKQYLLEENRRMVAVDQHIQYFKEFLNGDLVIIKSKITEIKNKTIKFTHKMYKGQEHEVAAVCDTVGVHIDQESRKSMLFPDRLLLKVQRMIEK